MITPSPDRIRTRIQQLASFTGVEGQCTRRTYTPAFEDAVGYLTEEMVALGMVVRMDGFGNLIGRYDPLGSELPPIGIGSHIDTVADGGAFDGAMGIVVGLELIECLQESRTPPGSPVEIIAFAEEEGGVFGKGCLGSEYMTGNTSLEQLNTLVSINGGKPLAELAGSLPFGKPDYGEDHGWAVGHYAAFYEVHVEQGMTLEQSGHTVGIVQGVVGIMRNRIVFTGQSNHAGTTRMADRFDASVAMAELVLETRRIGTELADKLVATCGKIDIHPNQHNVIPGKSAVVIELRGDDNDTVVSALERIRGKAKDVARDNGLHISIDPEAFTPVKLFDETALAALHTVTTGAGDVTPIFSWAGHDAKIMANVAPTAMLFVPSRKGLSHCPEEFSDAGDIARAAEILLAVIV